MSKRRKPSAYRRIRGIRDDEIRGAIRTLLHRDEDTLRELERLRNHLNLLAGYVESFVSGPGLATFIEEIRKREEEAQKQAQVAETPAATPASEGAAREDVAVNGEESSQPLTQTHYSDDAHAPVCPDCHGTGGFAYKRNDTGEEFTEPCPSCQPAGEAAPLA